MLHILEGLVERGDTVAAEHCFTNDSQSAFAASSSYPLRNPERVAIDRQVSTHIFVHAYTF